MEKIKMFFSCYFLAGKYIHAASKNYRIVAFLEHSRNFKTDFKTLIIHQK